MEGERWRSLKKYLKIQEVLFDFGLLDPQIIEPDEPEVELMLDPQILDHIVGREIYGWSRGDMWLERILTGGRLRGDMEESKKWGDLWLEDGFLIDGRGRGRDGRGRSVMAGEEGVDWCEMGGERWKSPKKLLEGRSMTRGGISNWWEMKGERWKSPDIRPRAPSQSVVLTTSRSGITYHDKATQTETEEEDTIEKILKTITTLCTKVDSMGNEIQKLKTNEDNLKSKASISQEHDYKNAELCRSKDRKNPELKGDVGKHLKTHNICLNTAAGTSQRS
ncbi:hypothetical protein H5410_060093 [Solanum commersonii]|uniref:Uncharacterized protein n=1 Tax=Solanum commersonii TaxID=4109 RepID=A0A9J5W4L9_SOLCO|nr:hypothetical protein H5410_060093 [Solanum commersonii]